MTNDDAVRGQVSAAYGKAITAVKGEGASCGCGSRGGCCTGSGATEAIADLAGYTGEERAKHAYAAGSSFGCGNPLALAGVKPGQTVLDLGSGAGFDLLLAAGITGPSGKVIGVDMTEEMLAVAWENIKLAGADNVELRKGIIEMLPVEDASVDWVISNCVVNLSPDKPSVFREIYRVLKPGGGISVSDIVARDLPREIVESVTAYAACVGGAVSEEIYVRGLREAGFEAVEVRNRLVYTAGQMRDMLGIAFSGQLLPDNAGELLQAVAGNVWSARFTARKPLRPRT